MKPTTVWDPNITLRHFVFLFYCPWSSGAFLSFPIVPVFLPSLLSFPVSLTSCTRPVIRTLYTHTPI